jgi:hypothetical protein
VTLLTDVHSSVVPLGNTEGDSQRDHFGAQGGSRVVPQMPRIGGWDMRRYVGKDVLLACVVSDGDYSAMPSAGQDPAWALQSH